MSASVGGAWPFSGCVQGWTIPEVILVKTRTARAQGETNHSCQGRAYHSPRHWDWPLAYLPHFLALAPQFWDTCARAIELDGTAISALDEALAQEVLQRTQGWNSHFARGLKMYPKIRVRN